MLNIMTWYWKQSKGWSEYSPEHVNKWYEQLKPNITIPCTYSCVTDIPEGINPEINIIPLPHDFDDIRTETHSLAKGAPQCFRRLKMFDPECDIFGERFVSMDLDLKVFSNLDSIFDRDDDFIIIQSPKKTRPYNGSIMMMNRGARPQVYTKFNQTMATLSGQAYVGSDQAWISYCLGWNENVWTEDDGIYLMSPRLYTKTVRKRKFPKNCKLLFYPGKHKRLVMEVGAGLDDEEDPKRRVTQRDRVTEIILRDAKR